MWWCQLNVSFHVNTQRPIDSCFIFSHSIISLLTSRAGQESLFVTLFLIFESVDLRPKPPTTFRPTLPQLTFQIINLKTFEYHPYQWSKWLSILANVAIFRQIVSTFRPLPAYFIFQKYCIACVRWYLKNFVLLIYHTFARFPLLHTSRLRKSIAVF